MSFLRSVSIAALLLLGSVTGSSAQHYSGVTPFGRDFYAPLITPKGGCNLNALAGASVLVSAPYPCTVTISYFDSRTGVEISGGTYTLSAKTYRAIPLSDTYLKLQNDAGDNAEFAAMRLQAGAPITAYIYTSGAANGSMSRILPTGLLGKEYVASTLPSNDGTGGATLYCSSSAASSLFVVLAVVDSTHVTITPNGTTLGKHTGVSSGSGSNGTTHPYTVTLRRGQVYFVKSERADNETDEAGSLITADKPISVWGGHEAALNGHSNMESLGSEQRNVLMQQMVPTIYWRSKDYFSIPLLDSPGAPEGDASAGDKLRVFTSEVGNAIHVDVDSIGLRTATINRFQSMNVDNVTKAAAISSSSGQPIMPVLFDYRQTYDAVPFPAPTMMVLTPWQNRALVQSIAVVDPYHTFPEKLAYLTVIAPRTVLPKIKLWTNGIGPKPLTSLPTSGGTYAIPGHPELVGRRFQVTPASYFLISDSGFLAYLSGDVGFSRNFGSFNGSNPDNYCTSFATPLSEAFGVDSGKSPTAVAVQNCTSWDIDIHSHDTLGIAQVEILNDPLGIWRKRPGSDSGYSSTNVTFAPSNFALTAGDTAPHIRVTVANQLKDADAYVWIVGRSGFDTLIHLTYSAYSFGFSQDTLSFRNTPYQQRICKTINFVNSNSGARTIVVDSLWHHDTNFTITPSIPLPAVLHSGDSLTFTVCFHSTSPTKPGLDTIWLDLDRCVSAALPVLGTTVYGSIYATDYDFGIRRVGDSSMGVVKVQNTGTGSLQLTGVQQTYGSSDFRFASTVSFPITLAAGQSQDFNFQYVPTHTGHDTAAFYWITDSPIPEKSYSSLVGLGIEPGLAWYPTRAYFGTWNMQQDTIRLFNPTSPGYGQTVMIDSVKIAGADANDFSMIANQTNYDPLVNFDMNPRDSIWILISFHPDTTVNTAARHARIIAYDASGIRPVANLYGSIGVAAVAATPRQPGTPIQVEGANVLLRSDGPATAEVFSILGDEVLGPIEFRNATILDLANLPRGIYLIRLQSKTGTSALKILR